MQKQEDEFAGHQFELTERELLCDILSSVAGGVFCVAFSGENASWGRLIYASEPLCHMLGFTEQELAQRMAQQPQQILFCEDQGIAVALVRRAIREQRTTLQMELRVCTAEGKLCYLLCSCALRKAGNFWILTGVQQEITARREAENQLRKREAQLSLAVSQIAADVWEYDIATERLSTGIGKATPVVIENAPESQIADGTIHPDHAAAARAMYREIASGAGSVDYTLRMRGASGVYSWRKCSFSTVFDQNHLPVRAVGIVTDISDEVETRRRYQQERQYRAALSMRTVTTVDIDLTADTCVRQFVAPGSHIAAGEATRFSSFAQLLCTRAVHPDDRERIAALLNPAALQRAMQRGEREIEAEYRGHNRVTDRYLWLKMTIHLFLDEESSHLCGSLYVRDIDEKKNEELKIRERADHDPLTGLLNRSSFAALAENALESHRGREHAFLMLDIDNFKQINDTFGHAFGDELLGTVAQQLRGTFRENDLIGRMGGDEFAVFLSDTGDQESVCRRAAEICEALDIQVEEGGYTANISCSIGIAFAPVHGNTMGELYANADKAQYRAKRSGKNQLAVFGSTGAPESPDEMTTLALAVYENTPEPARALTRLMRVIGTRMNVDRVMVSQPDPRLPDAGIIAQWTAPGVVEYEEPADETARTAALTLWKDAFRLRGTTVFFGGEVPAMTAPFLTQGNAATVIFCAMYSGGRYRGMLSLTSLTKRRIWTEKERRTLTELAKIISEQMALNRARQQNNTEEVTPEHRDVLTGLVCYDIFKTRAQAVLESGAGSDYILVCTDICNMKLLNEQCGYAVGDRILKELATFYAAAAGALVSRIYGDHFIGMFPVQLPMAAVCEALERGHQEFCDRMAELFPGTGMALRSGVYRVVRTDVEISPAIDRANAARKAQREAAGAGCMVYSEQLGHRMRMENDLLRRLPDALKRGDIQMFLQPKVNLRTGRIIGAEALVRWRSEGDHMLLPGAFVPLLERSGLISKIDLFMLEQTVNWLLRRNREGRVLCPVSVNASGLPLVLESRLEQIAERLTSEGVEPAAIEFELTERAVVTDPARVKRVVERFREQGFLTAIDDMGAGYSVLNILTDMPVDIIKLDRGFINSCQNSVRGMAFLAQLIQGFKTMEYTVLCEGIENEKQAELMKQAGCDLAQGFYFGRPMSVEAFEELFDAQFRESNAVNC